MFIAVYFNNEGKSEEETVTLCRRYAEKFTEKFGSLICFDLHPNGFTPEDPPHLCEELTCKAIQFAWEFLCENGA